ncbi:MAG: PKD domain-containing protein [Elusimicrobiota bacterium]
MMRRSSAILAGLLATVLCARAWAVPDSPALEFPVDGRLTSDRTPSFDWADVPGASLYRLEVSLNSGFTSIVQSISGITESRYTLTGPSPYGLERGKTYYWRVIAKDETGESPPSGGRSLKLRLNTITYDFELSDNEAFAPPLVAARTLSSEDPMVATASEVTLTDEERLPNDALLFWRVRAIDSSGNVPAFVATRKFTTIEPLDPAALLLPADGSKPITPTPLLDWADVPAATQYTVTVSTDPGLEPALFTRNSGSSQYQAVSGDNLQDQATYYWRVKAADAGRISLSDTRSFMINSLDPAALLFPADRRRTSDRTPSLQWSVPPDMTGLSFTLEMAVNSSFSSLQFTRSGLVTGAYTLAGAGGELLERGKTYYWRVKTIDPGGQVVTSASRRLLVVHDTITYDLEIADEDSFSPPLIFARTLASDDPMVPTTSEVTLSEAERLPNDALLFWRVRAVDSAGNAPAFVLTRKFTVVTAPPVAVLLSPAEGARPITPTPLLDWTDVPGATQYTVTVSTEPGLEPALFTRNSGASQYQVASSDNLQDGIAYFWSVKTTIGIRTSYSETRSFTIAALEPAELLFPADRRLTSDRTPTLQWSMPQDMTGLSFTLEVALNSSFSSMLFTKTGLSTGTYTLTGDLPERFERGKTYYWRVKTIDAGGQILTSLTRKLQVRLNTYTFTLEVDDELPMAPPFVFTRTVTSDDPMVPTTDKITLAPEEALPYGAVLYWRVRAIDAAGNESVRAPESKFTVVDRLEAAILLNPYDGARSYTRTPLMDWTDVPSATDYTVSFSFNDAMDPVLFSRNTGASQYQTASGDSLQDLTTYYWQVDASGEGQTSSSAIQRFFVRLSDLSAPEFLLPENGATVRTRTPLLDWSDVADATSYTVFFSSKEALEPLLVNPSITVSEFQITEGDNLENGTTYYWRVESRTAGGEFAISPIQSFLVQEIVVVLPPGPVDPLYPPDGRLTSDRTPSLEWSPHEDMSGLSFTLEVSKNTSFSSLQFSRSGLTEGRYTLAGTGGEELERGKTYYWRVKTVPFAGDPLVSSARSLKVRLNTITYDLEVDDEASFSPPLTFARTLASADPMAATPSEVALTDEERLANDAVLFWRVKAADAAGNASGGGPARSFTVISALPAAALLAPWNGSTPFTRTPLMDWEDVPAANQYTVTVSTEPDLEPALFTRNSGSSQYQVASGDDFADGTVYYWSVKATDGGRVSFSETWSFTPVTLAPAALLYPPDGRLTSDRTPSLQWSMPGNMTGLSFTLEVSKNSSFSSLQFSQPGISTGAYTLTGETPQRLDRGMTYYWRVKTVDPGGQEIVSGYRTLKVRLDTITYDLEVSDNETFTPPLIVAKTLSSGDPMVATPSEFTLSAEERLSNDAVLFWRVKVADSAGNAPAFFLARKFTVIAPLPTAALLVPPDVSTSVTRTPLMDWTDVAGASNYAVTISTDPGLQPALFTRNSGSSQYQTTSSDNLQDLTSYYWQVKASGGGRDSFSATRSFIIQSLAPATLLYPPDGRLTSDKTPSLRWSVPEDLTGLSFTLEVSKNSSFSSLQFSQPGISSGTYTLTGDTPQRLDRGKTYYWRVRTIDERGQQLTSGSRSLRVGLNQIAYRLQVSGLSDFSALLIDEPVAPSADPLVETPSLYAVPAFQVLENRKTHYWRVGARDAGGNEALLSPARKFKVDDPDPGPILLDPDDDARLLSATPFTDWTDVIGVDSYEFLVARDAGFASPVVTQNVVVSMTRVRTVDNLQLDTRYFWKVSALSQGTTTYYPTRSFIVTEDIPNERPVAVADSTSTLEDVPFPIFVLANDFDPEGDPLVVAEHTQASHGTLQLSLGATVVFYTPDEDFYGSDSFTYRASDSDLVSTNTVTVSITIEAVNDAPVAVADSATTAEDTAVSIDVLANDSDIDSPELSIAEVSDPPNGSASLQDGAILYTPDLNFFGTDEFTCTITDGELTAAADVTVTVTPVNDAPVAVDDSTTTPGFDPYEIEVLLNDVDVEGDALAVHSFTPPTSGSLELSPDDKVFTFTRDPGFNGTVFFTYTATDQALESTNTATVSVFGTNKPAAVDAGADQEIGEGQSVSLPPATFTDVDIETHTAVIDWGDETVEAGELDEEAGTVSGSHPYPDDGTFTVTVTVRDAAGNEGSDSFEVTVNNVAPAVEAGADRTIDEGSVFAGSGSFTDPGADTWTATVDYGDGGDPEALELDPDKTFALEHPYRNQGEYTVTVRVEDDEEAAGEGALTVTVLNVVPTPNAGGPYEIDEMTALTLVGSATDPGPDDTLAFAWDLDGDGEFDDAAGAGPELSWAELQALGLGVAPETFNTPLPIALSVADDETSATAATTLTILDRTPPTPPGDVVAGETPNNTGDVTVTWTAAADPGGSGVEDYLVLRKDGEDDFERIATVPKGTLEIEETSLPDGAYTYRIVARDRAGNESEPADSNPVLVDKTAPTITAILAPPPNPAGWNNSDVTIFFNCADEPGGSGLAPDACPAARTVTGQGADQDDTAGVSDLAGNTGTVEYAVSLDKESPSVLITAPSGGQYVATRDPIRIDFTLTDNLDPAPAFTATLELRAAGTGAPGKPTRRTVENGETLEPLDLAAGLWRLTVSATDQADNPALAIGAEFEIIHDIMEPRTTVSVAEPRYPDATEPEPAVIYLTGTTDVTASSIDDLVAVDGLGLGVATQTITVGGNPRFEYVNPAPAIGQTYANTFTLSDTDGPLALLAEAVDTLGNAETGVPVSLHVDNTAPVMDRGFSAEPVVREPKNEEWFAADFEIIWSAGDGMGSGVAHLDGPTPVTAEAAGADYTGRSVDNVDNERTLTVRVNLDKTAPVVNAGADSTVEEGAELVFSATVTDNLDAAVVYGWTFGDGGIAGRELTPAHAYLDEGTYEVTLTATDHAAHPASDSLTVTVTNSAPIVTAGPDRSTKEGSLVGISATFTDAGILDTHAAEVDWGDGTTSPASLTETDGSGSLSAEHVYADDRVYAVKITVTDDDGDAGEATLAVAVENVRPTIEAGADQTVDEGAPISLAPSTFRDQGALDTHTATIDWGDDTGVQAAAVTQSPFGPPGDTAGQGGTIAASHVYADNDAYTVTVCVKDDDDAEKCDTLTASVNNVAPTMEAVTDKIAAADGRLIVGGGIPVRSMDVWRLGQSGLQSVVIGPDEPVAAPPIEFHDQGTLDTHGVLIEWGDTTSDAATVTESPFGPPGSTGGADGSAVAPHQYTANGYYPLKATVTDDDGGQTDDGYLVTVDVEPPVTTISHSGNVSMGAGTPAQVSVFLDAGAMNALSATDPMINGIAFGAQWTFRRDLSFEGSNSTYTVHEVAFNLAEEGVHTLEYFSVDRRGNEETHKLITIGVDHTPPIPALAVGDPHFIRFGLTIIEPETPIILSAEDPVTSDVASGLDRITYRIDGGELLTYAEPFTLDEGTHVIDYGAVDKVENEARETFTVAVAAFQVTGVERVDGTGSSDIKGLLRSNGLVDLGGSSRVDGDVIAGNVTLKGKAEVTGTITEGASPVQAEPIDLELAESLALAISATSTIPDEFMSGGEIVVNSGRTLTLATGTYVVEGLRIAGGGSIETAGAVNILVRGEVRVTGGGSLNAAGHASELAVFTNTSQPTHFSGGALVVGIFYGPRGELQVAGNTRVGGHLFAKTAKFSGTANVVGIGESLPEELEDPNGGKGGKTAGSGSAALSGTADPGFALRAAYVFPNPAVGGARPTVHIAVGIADKVTLRIYNVAGQQAHQVTLEGTPPVIDDGSGSKFAYEYTWDGHIPSGVYLYTFVAEKAGESGIRRAGKFAVIR